MKLSSANALRPAAAFTMIEVAICLAIIGVALVGIIGVLPRGMNTQRDNREETIVGQDASQLMEIIRNGARGQDDLTNYVFAVTNYWYWTNGSGSGFATNGYTYQNANVAGSPPSANNPYAVIAPINSGSNIVSLLSTPEFMSMGANNFGAAIPNLLEGGISNHVVVYMRALSGMAAEKPPQDNPIMSGDAFSYRVLCVNAPVAQDAQLWQGFSYNQGAQVYLGGRFWLAAVPTAATDVPGLSTNWVRSFYSDQLAAGQREIRLRFLWPILPNGDVGNNYQNFRVTVGGQLMVTNNGLIPPLLQFYYQPQSFVQIP